VSPFDGLTLLEASKEQGRYRALYRLESGSPVLSGHFPEHPILPGIAHLGLALQGAREIEGSGAALLSLHGVRFRRAVVPQDTIELVVVRGSGPGALRFEVRRGETVASSGALVMGDHVRG
jgi:3-hydroxymyristoyl/3-hydroxydecanoyl-(acyl carrier protein) dehydratase